jgi:type VI secretion system protein ImpM
MVLALYGKHPGRGDFLTRGIAPRLQAPLEAWLDQVLAELRDTLGPEWETVWDSGTCLNFWVGEAIWGLPVAGVMRSSRDKVGRRFPLMILAQGEVPAPPTLGPDPWHRAVAEALDASLSAPDIDDPLAGPEVHAPESSVDGAGFWAIRPGADATGLWSDLAANDHRRAAVGRSYWWVSGEADKDTAPDEVNADPVLPPRWTQVWAGAGLPSGAVLAWFFRGYRSND